MQPYIALPAIAALLYRAHTRSTLTPPALLTAGLTALIHALHPWSLPFLLLGLFFLLGNLVTKVHHARKASLTTTSTGGVVDPTTPAPRGVLQVLANSGTASALVLLHTYLLSHGGGDAERRSCMKGTSPGGVKDLLLPLAICAHYAAVTADTFSSELGILARGRPFLITSLRAVPPGTNGGVTVQGLGAGLGGALLIGAFSSVVAPFCGGDGEWSVAGKLGLVVFLGAAGLMGSLVDSVLGAVAQASVVDSRTGKVVEGEGGAKVRYLVLHGAGAGLATGEKEDAGAKGGRKVVSGNDLLSNNGVNFVMTVIVAAGTMLVGGWWFN